METIFPHFRAEMNLNESSRNSPFSPNTQQQFYPGNNIVDILTTLAHSNQVSLLLKVVELIFLDLRKFVDSIRKFET